MEFMVPGVAVSHPKNISLVRLQPGKRHGLEVVHYACFLFGCDVVIRVPGQHPGGEFPFGVQGVDQLSCQLRIATQHFGRMLVPARIILAHQIVRRSIPAALAVWKHLHVHGDSPERFDSREEDDSQPVETAYCLSIFSMLTRAANT